MRRFVLAAAVSCLFLTGCGSEPAPTKAVQKAPAPKPADESRRFPTANLKSTTVVDEHMLGHTFLPGGTLATYAKGAKEYKLFLVKFPDATQAGIALLDYKNKLKDPKFIASFGGYFGEDAGVPVFVFAKNEWLLGVQGLDQKDADLAAREFAGRI